MHCLSHEQLVAVISGLVSTEEEDAIDLHLTDCAACQYELERLASESQLVAGLKSMEPESAAVRRLVAAHRKNDSHQRTETTQFSQPSNFDLVESSQLVIDPPPIPGFEFIELLGRGGMGVVWKAYETSLDRIVAIKVMAPHLLQSDVARQRFLQEARAVAKISNDYVVTVHAVGDAAGIPYLVMAFIEGESLEQRLQREYKLQPAAAIRLAAHVARALEAAHQAGVIHRDIKPGNVLLEAKTNRALLVDFGLARAADEVNLTRTGVVAGTPEYMSPEQIQGSEVDHSTDLFSLGGVLYRALAGEPPFRGKSAFAVAHQIVQEEVPSLRQLSGTVPPWFADVIDKLMNKRADGRFNSASELIDAIQHQSMTLPVNDLQPKGRSTRNVVAIMCLAIVIGVSLTLALIAVQTSDVVDALEPPPPCVVKHADGTMTTFDDLPSAIRQAKDGETIELSDAHVWELDSPMTIKQGQLSIAAMLGTRPIIRTKLAERHSHLWLVENEVNVTGLTFRFQTVKNAPPGSALIVVDGGALKLDDCRFANEKVATRHPCVGVKGSGTCDVAGTFFIAGPNATATSLQAGDGGQLRISNCYIAAGKAVSIAAPRLSNNPRDTQLQLRNTTCDTNSVISFFAGRMRLPTTPLVEIDAVGNTLHSRFVLSISSPNNVPPDAAGSIALEQLRRAVSWSGEGNVFSFRADDESLDHSAMSYCGFLFRRERLMPIRSGPKSLISWQDYCAWEGDSSRQAPITFTAPASQRRHQHRNVFRRQPSLASLHSIGSFRSSSFIFLGKLAVLLDLRKKIQEF